MVDTTSESSINRILADGNGLLPGLICLDDFQGSLSPMRRQDPVAWLDEEAIQCDNADRLRDVGLADAHWNGPHDGHGGTRAHPRR
jgi:hypothetical protein